MSAQLAQALKAKRARLTVLKAGLLACYEIIDRIRKEMAELESDQ